MNIFSFRDGTDESGRSDYDQHNVQILDVADDGTVEFLVYGYMNRGNHEGNQGLGLYSYSKDGAVTERFFADSSRSACSCRFASCPQYFSLTASKAPKRSSSL